MLLLLLILLGLLVYALLAELEKSREPLPPPAQSCPGCARPVAGDWLICPHCRTLLREVCSGCGRQHALGHRFCPFCGRPGERR